MSTTPMHTTNDQSSQAAARALDDSGHDEHHVLPVALYVKVYGALLLLTYLTVHISYMSLGGFSLPAALAVAVVKAGLVVGFFMHLRYDARFNSFIFFGTIIFVAIFFGFTMLDITSRDAVNADAGTFAYEQESQAVDNANAMVDRLESSSPAGATEAAPAEAPEQSATD